MSMFEHPAFAALARRARACAAALIFAVNAAGAFLPALPGVPATAGALAVAALAADPAPAHAAYNADPFGDVESKGSDITKFVFKMLRYGALIGIAVAVGLGFFGNLNWGTVFYIALGCIVVSIAPGLIDWLGSGQFNSMSLQ